MSSLSLNVLKCIGVFKSGLKKGLPCTHNAKYNTFCGIHNIVDNNKCCAILKTGEHRGLRCNNNKKYLEFCGVHKKNIISVPVPDPVFEPVSEPVSESVSDPVSESVSDPVSKPISVNKIENINTNHEIYIIKLSEHIRCNDDIFKVGMTRRGTPSRYKGYPKNSKILFSTIVKDALLCERFVLENCRKESRLIRCDRKNKEEHKRLGNEYFEGDFNLLLNIVKTSCEEFNKKHTS